MTMIRFTGMFDKILDHTKKRTIRKKRKCNCGASILQFEKITNQPIFKRDECICQIEKGDTLQIYLLMKIGDAKVTDVQKLESIYDLTDEDARLDGFSDCEEAFETFQRMHKDDLDDFRIIDFEPDWPKQKVVPLEFERPIKLHFDICLGLLQRD